ncbi:hypothetical protein O6H91_04G129100 [Diphasiastrum complanatum]|uniref:Uncharacterized protein n=1 Tax=Diphasiastrum complanatum TaxID=34168 RepID=A0ACC2E1T0_DIPCM|nr:hypothetical protein O6H91_04G129100 [Diphasiastrum complanatum]
MIRCEAAIRMGDTAEEEEEEEEDCSAAGQAKIARKLDGSSASLGSGFDSRDEVRILHKLYSKERDRELRTAFPDEALEHVLAFVTEPKNRNAVSLVCKAWYKTEGWSRRHVFIGNCYAASPEILIRRFPKMKALTLKGKPRFADFNLVPPDWGAHLHPWVTAIAAAYPGFEELRIKRMTASDESLQLLAHSFPNFRSLVMTSCDGFSTDGLAALTSRCSNLEELHLQESEVEDRGGHWLNSFQECCTSLVTLNFACLDSDVDFDVLENLVARCTSLKNLGLNKKISLEQLQRLLVRAPKLTSLGTGSFNQNLRWSQLGELSAALVNCKGLQSLSGFWDVEPLYIAMLYPLCSNLTHLDLSYATIRSVDMIGLIRHCHKLQKLWVRDFVEDRGLQAVAATCKDLQELRVFPVDPLGRGYVTERGLIAIAEGCPNLSSILYFCRQMTNAAIITMSRNCQKITRFRLCIITPKEPDHVTKEPLDEAFGAIAKNCKRLKRLSVSGLLTDKAFEYIGKYGKRLETLSVAFAGDSDRGMEYVLRGCTNLRKLEIRDCPFGDAALLSGFHKYESMRLLWMSSCNLSINGCMWLAKKMPRLNVEVMKENMGTGDYVEKLYVYRSIDGPRNDAPYFVVTL